MARNPSNPLNRKPPPRAAFAVRYYEVSDWPVIGSDSPLVVPRGRLLQSTLEDDEGPPRTEFIANSLWRAPEFLKLDVMHERTRRAYHGAFFMQNWRVRKETVNAVIERYMFTAYVAPDRQGIFMRANGMVAEGALRRVQNDIGVGYRRREIDVKTFRAEYRSPVSKAWFSNMKIKNLQSASLAGRGVDRSDDFARFLDQADLSAVILDVEFEGHRHDVMVSQSNTIFFYMANEAGAIKLASHVNGILDKYADVVVGNQEEPERESEEDSGPDVSSGFGTQEQRLDDG